MAVVTRKSAAMTNRDATPRVLNDSAVVNGHKKVAKGVVSLTSGDSSTSTYLICSLPSSAIPLSVKVSCPDIGTTATMDIGLYKSTSDGGAVVDADFFKAAVDIHSGALSKSEIVNGNVVTVANMEKRIWEHLALSADSGLTYDVVGTLAADTDAAGAVFVEIEYL